MRQLLTSFVAVVLGLSGCHRQPDKLPPLGNAVISQVVARMTDVMVHDVTNPPLAARFFAYACLAGYEVVAQHDSTYPSMRGTLNDYPAIEKPADLPRHSPELSAVLAMLATAKKMQPSGTLLQAYEDRLLDSCRTLGFAEETIDQSKQYALAVSKQILAYAKADRYNRISNYPRYTPTAGGGNWYPTPPGFFAPVEPYFNTVRP
ncbi:MAG: haloperoxidase, partial [Bacteroidetes bacterium]|nr:haloperoxidase [Fibrella sp.]